MGNRKQIQTIFNVTAKGTINGSVREGSGNWLEKDAEGNVCLDGKYTIETEDKLIVPLDVNGIIAQDGKMKLRVFFHCGHKEYRHLNRNVVIAVGLVTGDIYRMDLHMLVDKAVQTNHNAFFEKPVLEHLTTLVAYYLANKPEDSDWVVLPSTNFNCYFGSTVFSKKVLKEITGKVIQRSDTSYGTGRYRVLEAFL